MRPQEKILTIRGTTFRLRVESSNASADYRKYDDLRDDIWGFPEDHMAGSRNLMCENFLHEGSSLFIGAYIDSPAGEPRDDRDHMAGFSYGFAGVKDKSICYQALDNLWFYSQYTAVRPAYRGYGLGIAIKEFQRDIVSRVLGIKTIVCTYDPLTGVNARRNVHHFGMTVLEYRAATFGEYGGRLNRSDVPTDRFFMSWDLSAVDARAALNPEEVFAAGKNVIEVATKGIAGRSGPGECEIAAEFRKDWKGRILLVRIPRDFYAMLRETDVDDPDVRAIPVEWRMATREAFQTLFAAGYRVVDFLGTVGPLRVPCYVLSLGPHAIL